MSISCLQHKVLLVVVPKEYGVHHGPHVLAVSEDQGLAQSHVISPPRGLVGHKPSDIYPSLQLVPGDKVVDLDGPLGHALDHVNEGDLGPEGHQILAELLEDCLLHSTLYHR